MQSSFLRVSKFIVLIAFSLFIFLSFVSYSPDDPSLNKATSNLVSNICGVYGAYIADPILAMLGKSAYLIPLFCFTHAIAILRIGISNHLLWISFFIIMLPTTAATIAFIPDNMPSKESAGGFIGAVIASELSLILPSWGYYSIILHIILLSVLLHIPLSLITRLACLLQIDKIIYNVMAFLKRLNPHYYFGRRLSKNLDDNDENQDIEVEIVQNKAASNFKQKARSQLSLLEGEYQFPSLTLLKSPDQQKKYQISEQSLSQNSKLLSRVLEDFGVNGEIVKIHPGPVVTLYELEPAAGIKSSRIIGLSDDIARSMSALSARISVTPGKSTLGIELPNAHREIVLLREILAAEGYSASTFKLPLVLGKNIAGDHVIADLAKMPHLLVAGTTGSGKSVAINTMILSLLYAHSPKSCKFIMIDPKMLELSVYDGIPHLLAPVVTEPNKAIAALKWVVKEMETRYKMMSTAGVRNIEGYNAEIKEAQKNGKKFERHIQIGFDQQTGKPKYETIELPSIELPFIVVIVDEMADLMLVAGKDIESLIQRLAQMARAAGIHIIMATQRPSVDVITGVIKANFPTRISFQVTSKIDSRTTLGEQGAESLLGMGDMLFMKGGGRIERVHGPFVSDKEVEQIVAFIKTQGLPEYIETITKVEDEDEMFSVLDDGSNDSNSLYSQAVAIVVRDKKASTSYIQRCLRIGYNKAADIIDRMEKEGVVSAPNHVGKRDVLVE